MKTDEFHNKFSIDTKAKRGVKALPKNAPAVFPEALTADGRIFDADQEYFYFDESAREVRHTKGMGLQRIDAGWLGSMGYKIVEIKNLRAEKDSALSDGQSHFKTEIEKLKKLIGDLELAKSPENRNLKSFLMARE